MWYVSFLFFKEKNHQRCMCGVGACFCCYLIALGKKERQLRENENGNDDSITIECRFAFALFAMVYNLFKQFLPVRAMCIIIIVCKIWHLFSYFFFATPTHSPRFFSHSFGIFFITHRIDIEWKKVWKWSLKQWVHFTFFMNWFVFCTFFLFFFCLCCHFHHFYSTKCHII